jgi:hypothetical protein
LEGKQTAQVNTHLARKGSTAEDDEIVSVFGTTKVVSLSRVVDDTRRSERSWLGVVVVENFATKTSRDNGKVSICESVASEKYKASFLADYWCSRASATENLRFPEGGTIGAKSNNLT